MGWLKLLQFFLCLFATALLLQSAESTIFVHFDQAPASRSRFSTTVFQYTILRPDGSNACKKHQECSFYCELDGKALKPCPVGSIKLKNLTANNNHHFLLNVTTANGDRNSSVYRWFIDTIQPTAFITSERNYTNAEETAIDITFSEPCTGGGGFKCVDTSNCDVEITGPARVVASKLYVVEPGIKYSLIVAFSTEITYGRVIIRMADNFCTDQAGNLFTRTNDSMVVVRFDRRPVQVDVWTSVPSYELEINKVPRTVLATNKLEDLEIFLDFSDCVVNSTKEILGVLNPNVGTFIPIHNQSHGNRRFVFKLKNVSGMKIITVKMQSASIIGRSGTPVSFVAPVTFLYDSTKPGVKLISSSPRETKESSIDVIVKFAKPVFDFDSSTLEVGEGTITRFKEHSKALYSLTITGKSHNGISVFVPKSKVKDVAGNLNLDSNRLEVRQCNYNSLGSLSVNSYEIDNSPPAISAALNSFVSAGLLATSLAATVLSLSSANLGAIGALTSGTNNVIGSDPSLNFLGMVGHLQVFVLSNWIAVKLPIEYSETTKGLSWLIPREKLPWNTKNASVWTNYDSSSEGQNSSAIRLKNLFVEPPIYQKRSYHSIKLNSKNSFHLQQDLTLRNLPLNPSEYSIYFLREEPFSAFIKRMDNYTGWQDFEMNLFWLGLICGSLLISRFLILLFLKWRTGTSVHGILSFPRFELFLLILMIPSICQSSAFVIRGGTTGGIISGFLLLAIPIALILSVFLFLVIAISTGALIQYKEIKHIGITKPWHSKLLVFLIGGPKTGRWFHKEGLPSSFVPRFGFLFEDRRGPPVYVLINHNNQNGIPKWIDSGQSGIGRMRVVNLDNTNEETKVSISKKLLGCARSAYLILDLLRRMILGIISGAYSSWKTSQSIIPLVLTVAQFLCLFILKPYIRREVNLVECVCLLCEAAIFGLSFYMDRSNPFEERNTGFLMLALLFISFLSQLVNEWYALIRCLLRFPLTRNPSLGLGLRCVLKGLIMPLLPRKYWSRLIPGSSQPKTGLVPVLPLSPETELGRRDDGSPCVDQRRAMTATIVPVQSPGSPSIITKTEATNPTGIQTSMMQRTGEASQQQGMKLKTKNEMKKLRELARASFSGSSKVDGASFNDSQASSSRIKTVMY